MVIQPSGPDSVSTPVPDLAVSPGPGGGLSSSIPTRGTVRLGSPASPGPQSSSGAWRGEAAREEEAWIEVKRKKSKPSLPPLDMLLRSGKGDSKSKSKS